MVDFLMVVLIVVCVAIYMWVIYEGIKVLID